MPDSPQDLASYPTVIGIALGLVGAAWKWFFSEWIRVSREIPSLEGEVATTSIERNASSRIVHIDVIWRNTSSLALDVQCADVRAFFMPVNQAPTTGLSDQNAIQENATQVLKPLEKCPWFVLEPNTASRMQLIVGFNSLEPQLMAFHLPLSKKHAARGQRLAFDRVAIV